MMKIMISKIKPMTLIQATYSQKNAFILFAGLIGLSTANLAFAADWQFDLGKTSVNFVTPPSGLTQVSGGFSKFDGQITGDIFDQKHVQISFTVQANSVSTGLGWRDSTLKGDSLFNVDKYPTITFKTTNVTQIDPAHVIMQGDLTMLGVTKPLKVKVTLEKPKMDPATKVVSISATADSVVSRSDWGMTGYSSFVGNDIAVHMVGVMTSNNVNPDDLAKVLKH